MENLLKKYSYINFHERDLDKLDTFFKNRNKRKHIIRQLEGRLKRAKEALDACLLSEYYITLIDDSKSQVKYYRYEEIFNNDYSITLEPSTIKQFKKWQKTALAMLEAKPAYVKIKEKYEKYKKQLKRFKGESDEEF